MKFIHTKDQIYLEDNSGNTLQYPLMEFLKDVSYPGLPRGYVLRVWEDGVSYIGDGISTYDDSSFNMEMSGIIHRLDELRANYEMRKIGNHQPIYIIANIDKRYVKHQNDTIHCDITISTSSEYGSSSVPISRQWGIHLQHEFSSEQKIYEDVILVDFVNGVSSFDYYYDSSVGPIGRWRVLPELFDVIPVQVDENTTVIYKPILCPYLNGEVYTSMSGYFEFTVYRELVSMSI